MEKETLIPEAFLATLPEPFSRLGLHTNYDWEPLPWDGISNKVLYFDRVTGATIELAKLEKGAEFPEHYHNTVQTLFLVSGKLRNHDTIITPGTFNVIPAGKLHGPFYAEEESIQFKYFSGSPMYILSTGELYLYKEDGKTLSFGKANMDEVLLNSNRENIIGY